MFIISIFSLNSIFNDETIFSVISIIDTSDGQCKIVVDGSVCDKYTQCTYLSDRDVSCVRGYELITAPISSPVISTSVTNLGGGSN